MLRSRYPTPTHSSTAGTTITCSAARPLPVLTASRLVVDTAAIEPVPPRTEGPVTIAHAANHRGAKGTEFIIDAVDRLRAEGEDVELVLIRSGDVLTVYRAATTIPEMIARLRALPAPPAVEARDVDELPERTGL